MIRTSPYSPSLKSSGSLNMRTITKIRLIALLIITIALFIAGMVWREGRSAAAEPAHRNVSANAGAVGFQSWLRAESDWDLCSELCYRYDRLPSHQGYVLKGRFRKQLCEPIVGGEFL